MTQSLRPIVYVETNWIVALALPHDRLHRAAVDLRNDAAANLCEIRVPFAALSEARSRALSEMGKQPRVLQEVRGVLENALRAGWPGLDAAIHGLQSEAVSNYFKHDPASAIDALEQAQDIVLIDDPRAEQGQLARLRSLFPDHDRAFDRYVLAAVLADRGAQHDVPAVFCSADASAFRPSKRPNDPRSTLYRDAKLFWLEDFVWKDGVARWHGKFGPGSRATP